MRIDAYTMPTNDTDYSCLTKAIELIYPIIWGLYHTTSLVITSLGADTHTNMHNISGKSNSKKPGARQPVASARLV